jgi:hypothetical protein
MKNFHRRGAEGAEKQAEKTIRGRLSVGGKRIQAEL